MEFSRPEHWRGWPFPSPPNPGIKPGSPALQADSLPAEREAQTMAELPSKMYNLSGAVF